MTSRKTIFLAVVLTVPTWLVGCGGYTNENTPEIVVTPEMLDKMNREEAARLEKYRALAGGKGQELAPVEVDGAPMGIAMQKRSAALEKRKAAAQTARKKK